MCTVDFFEIIFIFLFLAVFFKITIKIIIITIIIIIKLIDFLICKTWLSIINLWFLIFTHNNFSFFRINKFLIFPINNFLLNTKKSGKLWKNLMLHRVFDSFFFKVCDFYIEHAILNFNSILLGILEILYDFLMCHLINERMINWIWLNFNLWFIRFFRAGILILKYKISRLL